MNPRGLAAGGVARPLLAALALAAGVVVAGTANACSCGPPAPPGERVEAALARGDAVFIGDPGRIIEITDRREPKERQYEEVKFTVLASWNGPRPGAEPFVTSTEFTCCVCGYRFTRKQPYVVFARQNPNGSYSVSACSLTRPEQEADELVRILDRLSKRISD